jgi:hypothetical protein
VKSKINLLERWKELKKTRRVYLIKSGFEKIENMG